MNYTKLNLAEAIAADVEEISLHEAERAVEAVLSKIVALEAGDTLEIRKFGTFSRVERRPIGKRNPVTGDPVNVAPYASLKFKPSKFTRS